MSEYYLGIVSTDWSYFSRAEVRLYEWKLLFLLLSVFCIIIIISSIINKTACTSCIYK